MVVCKPTRRQMLATMGVGGTLAAWSGCSGTMPGPDTTGQPLTPPEMPDDLDLRLLNRITFGPTADQFEEIAQIGYDAFLEEQLNPERIADTATDDALRSLPTLRQPLAELAQAEEPDFVAEELVLARVIRATQSNRQLLERVVEFWTDHFNIYHAGDAIKILKTIDDREVIRANALGNFRDMLHASSRSPAMLVYLDNATNLAGAPNENYARELLELHTVGRNSGYVQEDVEELARALTGWSVVQDGLAAGSFVFRANLHDDGPKQVIDLSLPASGGMDDGRMVFDYLAGLPQTARFIATKLVKHFVAESAPQSVVDRVTDAFLTSDGDMKTILREVFARESMRLAEPKFKRPLHFISDIIRRTGARIDESEELGFWLYVLGHVPFLWPAPDGYPDVAEHWAPGLLNRWNFATAYSFGDLVGARFDVLARVQREGDYAPAAVVDLWDRMFFAGQMPRDERAALHAYITDDPEDEGRLIYESFAMAISMPSFQWH